MPQIFRPHSNAVSCLVLAGIAGLVIGTGVIMEVVKWSPYMTEVRETVDQPVPFSHKHHVGGLGLDCRYCHTSVETSANAGMPPSHTCMTCHSQIWQSAPMLAPVRESYKKATPLRWNRVYKIPDYVYFNHAIHVNKGIGCTSCHARLDEQPLTYKARPFYMKTCLECHRDPERYIRPKEEVFSQDWVPPGNQLEQGRFLVEKYHIPVGHLTQCYVCHR